jgi:pimeloyl-ACP methyl ester carboxylesterase
MSTPSASVSFVEIAPAGRPQRIEVQRVGSAGAAAPVIVFLHEGLGSVAMWRDFPARLCEAAGARGLVYSRPGYGRSTARPADERWTPQFMHQQAHDILPALLRALQIDPARDPLWLFGHSDGGSIALLYAARFPQALQGAIVLAPHILVEDISVTSIEQAREAYLETDLKQRLARYHDDPDSAFWGWNDIWLDPAFRDWSIEQEIAAIRCPLLAIQGVDDEYGTLEQIRGIARRVPQARLLELPDCGHSPHKDQPQAVIDAAAAFMALSVRR